MLRPILCCSNQDRRFGTDKDQWNKIKRTEIDLQKYGSLIFFGQGEKAIKWTHGSLFTKYLGKLGIIHNIKNTLISTSCFILKSLKESYI